MLGNLTQEATEHMFRSGIASALNISIERVVKLIASEVQQGSRLRRLRSVQTKLFEVSYEVSFPSSTDLEVFVTKLNSIAKAGSVESQVFRQVLADTEGVANVGVIVLKIAAYNMGDRITTTPSVTRVDEAKEENSLTAIIVGSIAIAMAFGCVGTAVVMIKRKMST